MVAGLLFLAFAYLAVGQAGVNRSGAQTAADAAALGAALDRRNQLADEWVNVVLHPTEWQDVFDGKGQLTDDPCLQAIRLAGRNDARVMHCSPEGLLAYRVIVKSNKPVGDSIVPGTENQYAEASATAVIKPRCTFKLPAADAGPDELPSLTCKNRSWELDPKDLTDLPKPEDLFDVHLAD